jgi:hypothetical protein
MLWNRFAMEFTFFRSFLLCLCPHFLTLSKPSGFEAYYTIFLAKIKKIITTEVTVKQED